MTWLWKSHKGNLGAIGTCEVYRLPGIWSDLSYGRRSLPKDKYAPGLNSEKENCSSWDLGDPGPLHEAKPFFEIEHADSSQQSQSFSKFEHQLHVRDSGGIVESYSQAGRTLETL